MIIDWFKENKKVIAFELIFIVVWISFVLGVCQLIPENQRRSGWFVEHEYQSQSKLIQK